MYGELLPELIVVPMHLFWFNILSINGLISVRGRGMATISIEDG